VESGAEALSATRHSGLGMLIPIEYELLDNTTSSIA
jgi:hypothetical protein